MKNKFLMSVNQNKTLVENHRLDFIYNNMILARYDVTVENCQNPKTLQSDSEERIALENFEAAYDYLLNNTEKEATYDDLMELHSILMNHLLDDTNNELNEEQIQELNEMINQPAKANTEIAIDVMLFILKERLFADGDVRVALMFANKIMLDNGCGFISIQPANAVTFRQYLKAYNMYDEKEEFKEWIYKYCVKGRRFDYLG